MDMAKTCRIKMATLTCKVHIRSYQGLLEQIDMLVVNCFF